MFEAPIRKDCPQCGQPAGERCVDGEGNLMEHFHVPRMANRGAAERYGRPSDHGQSVDFHLET